MRGTGPGGSLHAILRLHFAQEEEEAYLSLLDEPGRPEARPRAPGHRLNAPAWLPSVAGTFGPGRTGHRSLGRPPAAP
jgi:hypothetical protein